MTLLLLHRLPAAVVAALSATAALAQSPVPTPPPNAPAQTPAFPEQTRAPQIDSGVTLKTEIVADGLVQPWAVAVAPDGRMLVTERPARLRVVSPEGEVSEPVEGLPEVDARDQGGLLEVSLAPDFAESGVIYWTYAEPRGGGENGTALARGRLVEDASRVEDVEVIFRQRPAWASTKHFGSRIVWSGDERFYLTLGERSLPEPRQLAQDLDGHLGKVVRLDADGSAPADNPFTGDADARDEIWSYGHRNVQAAALHPETGALWTIAHGPQGGDEINAPEAGRNYGWPVITYGENYDGSPIGEGVTAKEGMEQPIYYWDPVIAPSGALFYQGEMFPGWRGDLLVGSLDPGALVRLDLEGERVVGEERLLGDIGRVRDLDVDADGALVLVIEARDGELVRVTAGE